MAPTRTDTEAAFDGFIECYGVKYEKAVECLSKDRDSLTRRAACAAERDLGDKATRRVRELVRAGNLDFEFVACSCRPGTEGTPACNYGRHCGTLKAAGRDVGEILIAEGLHSCRRHLALDFALKKSMHDSHGRRHAPPDRSAHDESRHLAVRDHFIGLASQEKPIDAAASMRCHDDQVAAFVLGCRDNALGWMLVLHMNQL